MIQITNKKQNPEPLVWEKELYPLAWYVDGDYHKELGLEPNLSTKLDCLDESLDGGVGKGLYAILSSEQRPLMALVTQMAESFASQDFGILFITPEGNLSILTSFILSRQSLLYDFPSSQKIDVIIPLTEKKIDTLSDKLLKESKPLLNNMGVIDSVDIMSGFLKARIKALQCKHEKFMSFIDVSSLNLSDFIDCLQEYRQLSEELEIPIIFYTKVPFEDGQELSRIGGMMDRLSQHVDHTMLLKRHYVNEDVTAIFEGKEIYDWILYELFVMSSYSAPSFNKKCYLSFYSDFGLFHEA